MIAYLKKKNFVSYSHFLEVLFLTPLYYRLKWMGEDIKQWDHFVSGCIKHEHEFENEPYQVRDYVYDRVAFYRCKHKGCNLEDPREERTAKGLELDRQLLEIKNRGAELEEKYRQLTT